MDESHVLSLSLLLSSSLTPAGLNKDVLQSHHLSATGHSEHAEIDALISPLPDSLVQPSPAHGGGMETI